jgi:tetratricopeptide (TPR) repeat protein
MKKIIYIFIILNCLSAAFAQAPLDIFDESKKLEDRIKVLEKMSNSSERDQNYFRLAQQCFQKGKYEFAEKLLNEFISTAQESKENSKHRLKAVAMLEYLMRYGPKSIKKTLKEAKELEASKKPLKKILKSCLVLIGRARDWKKRSVSQWNELADTVLKVLNKINDNGKSITASRIILLKVKVYELQGNNQQAVEILQECIKHYYPKLLGRTYRFPRRDMAPRRLLVALGKQYSAQANRARLKREKKQLYSKAAGCFIKAVKGLKSNHLEVANAKENVLQCQEALKLLGYKLRLPKSLQATAKDSAYLLEQMVKQKRYKAAMKAIEIQLKKNKKKPKVHLLRLYANTLGGNKMYPKALKVYQQAAKLKPEDKLLRQDILANAKAFHKVGADDEARELFALFIQIAPDHPDTEQALFQCANLSMHQKKYSYATKYFIKCADKTAKIPLKAKALFNAAQSEYQLKKYNSVLSITASAKDFEKSLSPTLVRDFTLLKAQALLKLAQTHTAPQSIEFSKRALAEFQKLIKLDNMPPEIKERVILMASFSAITAEKPNTAISLLEKYFLKHIKETSALQIANRLLELYFKHKKYNSIQKLAENMTADYPRPIKTREFVLNIGKTFVKKSLPGQVLKIYANFIQGNKFNESFLLQISKVLLQKEFDKPRSQADKLLIDIFAVNLPLAPAAPSSGEVYYQLANANFRQGNNKASLALINTMLAQRKVYCYFEVKTLHAKMMHKLKKYTSVIKDCQDMLLANPPAELRKEVTLYLADSYSQSGNDKKAIATAWTIVPLVPKKLSPEEKSKVQKLLKLIYSCSKKINSKTDQKESEEIYKSMFPNTNISE